MEGDIRCAQVCGRFGLDEALGLIGDGVQRQAL